MRGSAEERFWNLTIKKGPYDCWIFQGKGRSPGDYGFLKLKNGKRVMAHRFSWELANGQPIPEGMVIMHKCDTPPCVNPRHLEIGTRKQNAQDMVTKGRHGSVIGELNPNAKLAPEDILIIRELKLLGYNYAQIGREFSIAATNIQDICERKKWKHV